MSGEYAIVITEKGYTTLKLGDRGIIWSMGNPCWLELDCGSGFRVIIGWTRFTFLK